MTTLWDVSYKLYPFYKEEKWGLERWRNLPKVAVTKVIELQSNITYIRLKLSSQ